MKFYWILALVCLLIVTTFSTNVSAQCPPNEEIVECPTPCTECKYQFPNYCPIRVQCESGCDCKLGFARNDNGDCIPTEQCPTDGECSQNEEFRGCGPVCERCSDVHCISIECPNGGKCFCKVGYRRNEWGNCISADQCPAVPAPNESRACADNEEYSYCGTACPKTCLNYQQDIFCIAICVEGCFCKQGLVRDQNGVCIPQDQCKDQKCPLNEEIVSCVKPKWCNTCRIRGNCKLDSRRCRRGCDCKRGYFRRHENGECHPKEQCPLLNMRDPTENGNCSVSEEYRGGTACPITCQNKDSPPQICVAVEVMGCFCKSGLIRDTTSGRCVQPRQCPKPQCGVNQRFTTCVNPCNDCTTRGQCQFLVCNPGCDCNPGYHLHNGVCIPASSCPDSQSQLSSTDDRRCRRNEIYKAGCPSSCEKTCDNPNQPAVCIQACAPGCYCTDGFLRRKGDNSCVPQSECDGDGY